MTSSISFNRTRDNFTIGLVNLPIVLKPDTNGILRPEKVHDQKKQRDKYVVLSEYRYPFFELDTDDDKIWTEICDHYVKYKLDFYCHRTMRGWHFFSTNALRKEDYYKWLKCIHHYNPKCPMVTLRVKPNKWIDEKFVFKEGGIIAREFNKELEDLKKMIENQMVGLLQMKYYVVRYRMTGELGNL